MFITIVILKIIALLLLADLTTGLFHFLVDQYGVVNGRFMTNSVNLLLLHHDDPLKIRGQTYWELTGGVYKFAIIAFPLSLLIGFSWEFLLFLLLSCQSNFIHKWAHNKEENNPPFIRLLQKTKLIQNRKHHLVHHAGNFNNYYCVMTSFLNPLLDKIHFWQAIIKFLAIFGIEQAQKNQSKEIS